MKDYQNREQYSASHGLAMLLVIAIHVAGFYAFLRATSYRLTIVPATILHTKFIPPEPLKIESQTPLATSLSYPETSIIQPIPPDIHIETPAPPAPIQEAKQTLEHDAKPKQDEPTAPIIPPTRISSHHGSDKYPGKSVKDRESGRTEMKICISAEGIVDTVEVTKTSGFPRIDAAAIEVAKDTKFKPATRLGKPVTYCMLTGVRFSLH